MQHQIISSVATQQKRHPKVCFKGGTLLRVCWQRDYRFSEDLDFDWLDEADANKVEILDFFSRALARAAKRFGGEYEVRWGAHNMKVDWEFGGRAGAMKLDVKHRDFAQVRPSMHEWPIIGRHPQIPTQDKILGYTLESVLAAKLDCALSPDRAAPRDYYDLSKLMADPAIDRHAALTEFLRRRELHDPSFPVTGDWQSPIFDSTTAKMPALEARWSVIVDNGLIPDPAPPFDNIVSTLLDGLTAMSDLISSESGGEPPAPDAELAPHDGMILHEAATEPLPVSAPKGLPSQRCGKWMPKAKARCVLPRNHSGGCRSRN